ncbi:hypothetical protein Q8W14_03370 [Photobacterium damselae subsp. piscicida]|nr:hypothetical protein [Photobacterium damselae subsp. piscicida]
MTYENLQLTKNGQRSHVMVNIETTLPSLFVTIYALKKLRLKRLSTQGNIHRSLKFFYVYFFKKHKVTFDYAFHKAGYNISRFIEELDGFFYYLLDQQHLNNEEYIVGLGFMYTSITKANKGTYGGHIRHVGGFLSTSTTDT